MYLINTCACFLVTTDELHCQASSGRRQVFSLFNNYISQLIHKIKKWYAVSFNCIAIAKQDQKVQGVH